MNAGRILAESGYDTETLRVHIAPVDPHRINVWPASRLFRRFWRAGIKGVTQGKIVFVDPEVMSGDRDYLARLVIHELVHVRQFAATGHLRFYVAYGKDYLIGRLAGRSARDAYLEVAFEREAREVTARVVALR